MTIVKINYAVALLLLAAPSLTTAKLGEQEDRIKPDVEKAKKKHQEKLRLQRQQQRKRTFGCGDVEPWYDADGPFFDCNWYAQGNHCALYGNGYPGPPPPDPTQFWGYPQQTANEACCACGGGNIKLPKPCTGRCGCLCEDVPGFDYMCQVAAQNVDGDGCNDLPWFDMGDHTTNELCCVCGGGHNGIYLPC